MSSRRARGHNARNTQAVNQHRDGLKGPTGCGGNVEYSQLAVTSVTALIVALLSAWVTVRLAYRRSRQEKRCERRFDAYDRVIDVLYRTKEVWDSDLKEAAGESKRPDEEEKRQLAQYHETNGRSNEPSRSAITSWEAPLDQIHKRT